MAIQIDTMQCVGCGCCSDVCTQGALELGSTAVVNGEYCISCGACVDMCPAAAIAIEQ